MWNHSKCLILVTYHLQSIPLQDQLLVVDPKCLQKVLSCLCESKLLYETTNQLNLVVCHLQNTLS
jgi:hypothetical protein